MKEPSLLFDLISARAPSGTETEAVEVWRGAAERFADVSSDTLGSSFARIGSDQSSPTLALLGHIDEIGLSITHIDDRGYLAFVGIGHIDPGPITGQRVVIRGRDGEWITGVIGRDPQVAWGEPGSGDQASSPPSSIPLHDLRIDIGASDREDASRLVRVGDPGVLDVQPTSLANRRITGRALDNRIGAYLALETVRRLAEEGHSGSTVAIATVQEELGFYGATAAAYAVEPDLAIAIDVDYASDGVGAVSERVGHGPLGSGAIIYRSPTMHPVVVDLLIGAAEKAEIPYTLKTTNETTQTDADPLQVSRAGIPTGLVSVPVRNMHTGVEVASLDDIEAAAKLLTSFARELPSTLPTRYES